MHALTSAMPRLALALGLVLALVTAADAQYTLSAGDETGRFGDTVEVAITLDSDELLYGFQVAIQHDATLVELEDIVQGGALETLNDDEGPGYFQVNLAPGDADGGWVAMITGLIDDGAEEFPELPAGDGQEVLIYSYSVLSDATPGEFSDLSFEAIGAVDNIVTNIDIESVEPDTVDGSITILTPAVQDLVCEISDEGSCEVTLTWTNPVEFDTVTILKDDVEVASLTEGESSYTTSGDDNEPGVFTWTVIPNAAEEDGPESTCESDCEDTAIEFKRGDASNDGTVTGLGDGLFLLFWQFIEDSPEPQCMDAADANDSGGVSGLGDGLFLLNWQFLPDVSDDPPLPGPDECGPDPTDDDDEDPEFDLGCETTSKECE